jgi:diaminohydroxyphosphoribosylaminopyrimidine deaminase/5-amino-6-(5-phosphoribosylamino)uracil reductase
VWPSPTQRVPRAEFRKKCAEEKITAVMFEGGARLVSQILQDRQLDYLFVYRAPMILADEKAKPMFNGLRTERLINAIRLREVRNEMHGEDVLTRGLVTYPEKLFIDETTFSMA